MSEYIVDYELIPLKWRDGYGLSDADLTEEIVRCRDCKYYDDYTGCCTRRNYVAPMASTPDKFCAWGERRKP